MECAVVAPTLVPVKSGDRVKTDRRDAVKLARCHRAGDLTAVWVPDAGAEALRDLVRTREAAKQDQLRARHRLSKFLLRTGRRPVIGVKAWSQPYMAWVRQLRYEQAAQEWTRLDLLHEVEHNPNTGDRQGIFFKLSGSNGATVLYSTYLGGSGDDYDPVGERGLKFNNCRIYLAITSASDDLPYGGYFNADRATGWHWHA